MLLTIQRIQFQVSCCLLREQGGGSLVVVAMNSVISTASRRQVNCVSAAVERARFCRFSTSSGGDDSDGGPGAAGRGRGLGRGRGAFNNFVSTAGRARQGGVAARTTVIRRT